MNFFKSQITAQCLEVGVIRVSQCGREVHSIASAKMNRRVFGDDAFAQGSERDRKLNGRAGLRARRECKLLVHHGENASAGGLDGNYGSIHVAERINRGLTNHWIFAGGHVAFRDVIGHKRAGGKMFVIVMATSMQADASHWPVRDRTAAMREAVHAMSCMRSLHYFAGLGGGMRGIDGRGKCGYAQQNY